MSGIERWSIRIATALVTITGVAYGWMKYVLAPVEPWSAIHHPLQPLVLKLHILSAPLLVFALGMIAVRHVWRHIHERPASGRRSGWTAIVTAATMIATGYLIQAVTAEPWLFRLAIAHLAAGTGFAAAVALHHVATPGATLRDGSSRTTGTPGSPAPGLRSQRLPRSPTG